MRTLKLTTVLTLLLLAACTQPQPAADTAPAAPPFNLEEATIADLQAKMESGELTSKQIVEAYIARIREIDEAGPELRSVLQINPDAVTIAEELDRERAEKGPRGPMHGIPVLLKDNIDTADAMETTAGSLALLGSKPTRDAFLVRQLRDAGAVILGKTNLSEWANFRSTKSSSGWSARGGQTRNPYVITRNPSGSSSGSAVAVAANLTTVAIGTETDGSIVSPASHCGIVGIKPTLGLVSRSGIIPIAHSQDTAGPMARTVADAAILLAAMSGSDPDDAATADASEKAAAGYNDSLDPAALSGARIGVLKSDKFYLPKKVEPVLDAAIEAMKAAGAEVIEVELPNLGKTDEAEYEVLLYEFKADLANYLASRPDAKIKTVEDLIAFNEENAERELPWFGQEILDMSAKKGDLTDKDYLKALKTTKLLTQKEGIDKVMDEQKLDALVAISNGPAHLTDLVNGDSYTGGSSSPAAVSGYPSVTVPAGWVHGLPIGVSFFGKAWSEPKLIALAYSFEAATKQRKVPQMLETAGVSFAPVK
jgi:amidase